MKRRTITERLIAAVLSLVLVLGLIPAGPLHAEAADVGLGTVAAATEGLSVDNTDNANVKVTLGEVLTLEKVDDSVEGRTEGWYVGVAITAPEDYSENAEFNCYRPEDNNSLKVNFVENKDTKDGDVITMWALITEEWVKAGEITYRWEMNWDADDTFEQVVTLTVDPAKVVLMDENGEQVYPSLYATVSSSYGGQVTTSKDDNGNVSTILNVTNVEVPWLPADAATGRPEGWAIDATVVDPDGNATTYWLSLEPKGNNEEDYEDISGSIGDTFTWNNGKAQYMALEASGITLVKAEQEAPVFEDDRSEININLGDLSWDVACYFSNPVANDSLSTAVGEVGYSYTESESAKGAVSSLVDGRITFNWEKLKKAVEGGYCTIEVTAYFKETSTHKQSATTYILKIGTNLDTGVTFKESGTITKFYGNDGTSYSNPVTGIATDRNGNSLAKKITYSSKNENIATVDQEGNVTFKGIGTVTISATVEYSKRYSNTTVSYVLDIQKGTQTLEVDGPTVIEYLADSDVTAEYTVSGIVVTDIDPVVSSSDTNVATVELKDGVIVVTPVGVGTFTLTVSHPGNDFYNGDEEPLEIAVLYKQTNVAFENEGPVNVKYNDNNNQYTNVLVGAQGNGALTYVSNDENIATVDENGVVTIKTAGTVVITATKAGDGTYAAVSASYTLNIAKADQQIAFADADAAHTLDNSAESYTIEMAPTAGWYALDSDEVKFHYEIASKSNKIKETALSVDNNGNCVVNIGEGDYGVITVKVTRPGDACFNDWAGAVYTLTINEISIEGEFQFSGETTNDSGWYTSYGDLTHTGGYQLADHVEPGKHAGSEKYPLESDGVHSVILCLMKDRGWKHNYPAGTYKIDTQAPQSQIFYEDDLWGKVLEVLSFGYYKDKMTVTIRATDATSGVAAIYYNYNGEWQSDVPVGGEISFDIDAQYRGKVQYYAVDVAGNDERNGKENNEANTGNVEVIVDSVEPEITVTWSDAQLVAADGTRYYSGNAVATITIKEANFFNGEAYSEGDGEKRNMSTAGVLVYNNGNAIELDQTKWTEDKDEEGNVVWVNTVTLSAEGDHVLNVQYTDRSKNEATPYVSETITIDHTDPVVSVNIDAAENRIYSNEDIVVTVTIEEHNFNADDVKILLESVNSSGAAVKADVSDNRWTSVGDIHTIDLTFSVDANYTLDVEYTDMAKRESNDLPVQMLTVDKTAPTNLEIAYTNDVWGEVLEALTFGYYDAEMTVIIGATDATSGVAAIWYSLDGTNWIEAKCGGSTEEEISFTIAPQYRGKVQYYAVDKASNDTKVNDKAATGNVEVIVDSEDPEISVSWSDAQQVTENGTRYYSDKAVATITIKEANFFNGEAEADGKGEGVLVFVNNETAELDSKDWAQAVDADGKPIADTWVNTVTLSAEGDHVLNVQYTDRSKNEATPYVSETITIDHTDPVVSVNIDAAENRIYSNKNMTVTVTVNEHNFNPNDVKFLLESVNSSGAAVEAAVSRSDWNSNGDIHTIELTFSVDANYTLDVEYADMAKRASNDLPVQMLTVDKVAPTIVDISYSDGITVGYYNAPVTVTILATDDTSGVQSFVYSYINNENVSKVNAELLNQALKDADVRPIKDTNQFTATFQIPKETLVATNQFNGYVDITAYDYSGNNSNKNHKDEQSIVVDNIAPTATITYNDPVKTKNDVSYYAGDINATIVINEANFFDKDVKVSVTRNGANYPVNVKWVNNTVDRHTGTFTLAEDGDYIVRVTYTDRSSNKMADYTSNQLTRDTQLPTVKVTNIVSDSANTDAVYSFTITAEDTNFDVDAFVASLNAVVYNEDGTFSTESINLGEPVAVEAGKTYTYEIANLEKDAIYTLSCSVTDLANNNYSKILLDDGKEYGEVQFSINRDGSTFYLDENTSELVGDYYNQNVLNDLVVYEINADVLESHSVTLNGKELVEGTDYTVTAEGGNGSWMKYTYTVNKALCEAEGEYQLVISSKDKAGNDAFSDVKNATVRFVVDRTAPVITVTGMANGGRYQTESQTVTLIPTDDGGALSSILVKLVDDKGNTIKELINLSGEELAEALENGGGRLSFQIGEGLYQNVQIVCDDCSVSEEGHNVYDETFTDLSVSASGFMIFWANRVLRYSVMLLLLLLLLVVIYLLTRKKNKKN